MAKPKVALYWNASCGGCEEAWIDLNEDILKVVEAVDIVLWPCAGCLSESSNCLRKLAYLFDVHC